MFFFYTILMVSFKTIGDWFYIRKQAARFRGKGENDLNKIRSQFSSLEEWEKRAKTIKNGILNSVNLNPLPKRTPLNPQIHTERIYDGYKIRNVYLETIPGFYSTGSLYEPLEQSGALPLLLKPHGHKKNKRYTEDNQKICATFARMGVRVFTYDMIGYSDSTQVRHKIKNACTLQTWNSIRALDFILSIPGGDTLKVGVTGGSGGGTQTFLLTAVDERVCFSAPCVMVSHFFYGGCVCESGMPIHKGENYKTNNAEIAALAAPRPQLIISDGGDWTLLVPKREFPFIKSVYALYGKEHVVENAHFPDEGHDYGPTKRQPAYKFFAKHFGLSIKAFLNEDGNVDESKSFIEPVEKLKVFNDNHPIPSNALQSEEEIIASLESLK